MFDVSIKVKNYKCFGETAGFDEIRRVNLIIGRNNAGKSALLDIIEAVAGKRYEFDSATWRNGEKSEIVFESQIEQETIDSSFSSSQGGGTIPGNHRQYGQQYLGRKIAWSKDGRTTKLVNCDSEGIQPPIDQIGGHADALAGRMPVPLESKVFRRVNAERDIVPEGNDTGAISIQPNGDGITNAIQNFINRSNLPSDVVEVILLNALNEIFAHDAVFTDIVCQLHENNYWEIYLEEEHKGRIALSKSGSGLKTVIAVLVCIYLVPSIEEKALGEYIFGFEELENNIHPALLRRLNEFIYRASVDNDFLYFLTTHSNVLIDQFSKQEDAQIIHVTQSDAKSECLTVQTYVENNGILDDLDVRASDLLQANGIIWVEGPSDRSYLNRWINLWSEGGLKEGTHYQIIFYGGRLLSHLSADVPALVDESISILNTNRNAVIMIDSDKRTQQARINDTKQRIRQEFDELGALCWITKGKEIENYISSEVVDQLLSVQNSVPTGQYSSFFDHLDSIEAEVGSKYALKKPMLAETLAPLMTKDNMQHVLDLEEKMNKLCAQIENWNR